MLYPRNVRAFVLFCSFPLLVIVPSSLSRFFTHASHFSIGETREPLGGAADKVLFSVRKLDGDAFKSARLITKFADGLLSCKGLHSSLLKKHEKLQNYQQHTAPPARLAS